VTEKQFTAILSPAQKLANVATNIDEKVTMMYELSVESLKHEETQVAELKQQTSILKEIKDLLKGQNKVINQGGAKGSGSFAGLDKLNKDTVGIAVVAMVGISAAIVASAAMFTLIPTVSPAQLLTALAISVAFIPMSIAFSKIASILASVKGTKGATLPSGLSLSGSDNSGFMQLAGAALLSMVGMSFAVAMSSWILQLVMPVSMAQVGTAFFIGLAMVGLAYGYAQVVKALANVKEKRTGKVNSGDIFSMVGGSLISMVGMAVAVTMSSWIMQLIAPVSMAQVGTAFFIGLAMVGMAYGYAQVVKALAKVKDKRTGRVNTGDLFSMVGGALLSMVGMAAAVTMSSWIMQMIVPVSMDKLATAFAIGIVMIGAAFAYGLIAKATKRLKIKDLLMATAAIPLIAIGLTAAAWIFTFLPDTFKAPPVEWVLKSGLALVVFGLAFVAMTYTIAKLPLKDILMGVVGMAAVAVGILAVAWIFSILPDTFTEVPIGWVLGSAVALIGFGVVVGIIGAIIMATGGTGLAAIALGVVGMIIIAAGILAVAWILSYIPAGKLATVAKGLTDALLAPVNGIVDVLARLKNEIGIENLLPLAGGIIAVSASLLGLAAATAGVAAGGLIAGVANLGKAFFDGIAGFFGAEKSKGPMDILKDLVTMGPDIMVLSKGMDGLAGSLARVVSLSTLENVKRLNSLIKTTVLDNLSMGMMNGFSVKEYFAAYPKFLNDVAKGYGNIVTAQSGMDLQVLDKTTEMIKALAYLNEFGGDNAMEKLGESLVSAVKELSAMINKFGGSVDAQTENGAKSSGALEKATGAISSFVSKFTGGGDSSSTPQISNSDMGEVVDAIEELQRIVKRNKGFG
jgi:hypothetical protein